MKYRSVVAVHNIVLIVIITMTSSSSNADSTKDYIDNICNKTANLMYKKVCVKMLTPYSESLNYDLCLTTLTAVNISLIHAKHLVIKGNKLLQKKNISRRTVQDCVHHIMEAKSEINDSFDQMNNLGEGGGDWAFKVNSVQTWMSSAMTSLETCREEVSAYVKDATTFETKDRRRQVNNVLLNGTSTLNKVLSNTLAFANALANQDLHPHGYCGGN